MLKSIRLAGLVGALLLLAPVAVRAQSQVLQPLVPTTPQPAELSSLELQQFVQAIKQMQAIDLETQQKMAQALKKEGMSPERFQEIGKSLQNPNSPEATEVSPGERQKFEQIIGKMREIVQQSQPKKERAVTSQGLTMAQFNQIDQKVKQDPSLQQRVRQMLGR